MNRAHFYHTRSVEFIYASSIRTYLKKSFRIKTKLHILFFITLFFSSIAYGQVTPFTVLSNNMDTVNRRLYVEIMYEKPSCKDYQARFRLDWKTGTGVFVKVDSFLNNHGTFVNEGDSILQRPMAGGYKLRFDLSSYSLTPADSARICVESQELPYLCEGCGAGGSNQLFTSNDIREGCPYTGDDLLACHYRNNSAGKNWEAWIQDPRDCQPYRIVQMPDGRWWFAQNLNYQKDLNYRRLKEGSTMIEGNVGEYWCPSGLSAETNASVTGSNQSANTAAIDAASCKTYGALYSWTTAMALNGRTTDVEGASKSTPLGQLSKSQGICPEGWLIPSDYDYGLLLNTIEGCSTPTQKEGNAPCNHNYDDVTQGYYGTTSLLAAIKNTHSCPPHASSVDTFCATYTNPAWAWRRADYNGKMSTPYALGKDPYGFSMLPAGYRNWDGISYYDFGNRWLQWTSTQYNTSSAWFRHAYYHTAVGRHQTYKNQAFSVRCIRDGVVILSPSSIMQSTTGLALSVLPQVAGAMYTWSVESKDISDIAAKVSFPGNGTSSAHSLIAGLNLAVGDMGKSFSFILTVDDGENVRTYKKSIKVDCLTQPTAILGGDSAVCEGTSVTLSLEGGEIPGNMSWVWREKSADGREVGRGRSITITPAVTATYYVQAEGNAGCSSEVLSKEVKVANISHANILYGFYVCPNNTSIDAGEFLPDPISTGGLIPKYQWLRDGEVISGATGKNYTTPSNLTLGVWTTYSRTATLCGVSSASGGIRILPTDPQANANRYDSKTICSGGTATIAPGLDKTLTSSSPSSFQWQSSTNGTFWTNIAGATDVSYTTPALTATTYYRRLVIQCGATYTPASYSTITVNKGLVQSTENYNTYVCPNNTVHTITFPAPTTCTGGTPTYQWQTSTNNSTWTNIGGATGASYTTPAGLTVNTWTYYRRQATLAGVTVYSGYNAVMPHNGLQTNANSVASQIASCGSTVTLEPSLYVNIANGIPVYQWQSSTNGTSWTPIAGATESAYTTPVSSTMHYRRMITQCGSTYTPSVHSTITVSSISTPSIEGSVIGATAGSSVTLTASVGSDYTVDWYSAATGGTLLSSNSLTYTGTAPFTVYAEAKSKSGECASARTVGGAGVASMLFTSSAIEKVTLPAGTYVIEMAGGQGGAGGTGAAYAGGAAGKGGYVKGTVQLSVTTTFEVVSGKAGVAGRCELSNNKLMGGAGGFGAGGGGGAGSWQSGAVGCSGGGGGGLSMLRREDGTVVMVAGAGGGGAGGSSYASPTGIYYGVGTAGGNGGGNVGASGGPRNDASFYYCSSGGSQTEGGKYGRAATAAKCGVSGVMAAYDGGKFYGGGTFYTGTGGNPKTFQGGNSTNVYGGGYHGGGGGGGAGYFGGAGGGNYGFGDTGYGGGGGSSYVNTQFVTGVTNTQGAQSGDGYVRITRQ